MALLSQNIRAGGSGHAEGTFGIRLLLCCFLFTFFVSLDRQGQEVMDVSSDQIQEAVTQDTDLAEVLGNYL